MIKYLNLKMSPRQMLSLLSDSLSIKTLNHFIPTQVCQYTITPHQSETTFNKSSVVLSFIPRLSMMVYHPNIGVAPKKK